MFTGGASDGVTARPGTPHYVAMGPVEWLSPGVLFGSALEVALSGQFGRFADKREAAAVEEAMWWDASAAADPATGEFWFDFASDTGRRSPRDVGDSEAARTDAPEVSGLEDGERLPRGRLVVLGGDQAASRRQTARSTRTASSVRIPRRLSHPKTPPGRPGCSRSQGTTTGTTA